MNTKKQMNINYEYAKMIMINHCPFSYLNNLETILKIERELENIYSSYKNGENQIYIDRMIKDHFSEDAEEEEYYDEDEEDDFYFSLLKLCKILAGDDMKDQEELNDFYSCDSYFEIVKDTTNLFKVLSDIILGFIHLKNRGIDSLKMDKVSSEYVLEGTINDITDRDEIPVWMAKGKCTNEKGEIVNITQLDISKMKEGDKFVINFKEGSHYKLSLVVLFVKCEDEVQNKKYFLGINFIRVDPLKIIKYACNDEKILREVIQLYNQKVFDKLRENQKLIITSFIEKENMILKEVVKECGNDVNDLIPKDIVNNILTKMIYPELRDGSKIENDILKSSLNNIEMEYQKMKRLDENIRNDDDTNYDTIKKQIANFIAGCIKEIDVIKRQIFKNSKMKRDTLLKISSKIYSFLNTKSGIDFMEKYPKFKEVVENKRQELLQDIRQGEEWFKNILIQKKYE